MSDTPQLKMVGQESVSAQAQRLLGMIVKLRRQVRNVQFLDKYLSVVNDIMAVPYRMPMSPKALVTECSREACLFNSLTWAVLTWGKYARGESSDATNPCLDEVVRIATTGFNLYSAVPKEKGASFYVLRTGEEQRKLIEARRLADEKAISMRHSIREAEEELHEQDATQGGVEGGVGEVDLEQMAGEDTLLPDEGRDGEGAGVGVVESEAVERVGAGEEDEADVGPDREDEGEEGDKEVQRD